MINHAKEAIAAIDAALDGVDTKVADAKAFLATDDVTEDRGDLLDRAFPFVADDEIMQRAGEFYERDYNEGFIRKINDLRDQGKTDLEVYRYLMGDGRFASEAYQDQVRYIMLGIGKAPKSRLLAEVERAEGRTAPTVVSSASPARTNRRTARQAREFQSVQTVTNLPTGDQRGVACSRHDHHYVPTTHRTGSNMNAYGEIELASGNRIVIEHPNTGVPRTNMGRVRNENRDARDMNLLMLIGESTVSVPVLAEWMGITAAKVRASIKRMTEAGFVCRPSRARFALTEAGLQRIGQ